MPSPDAMTCQVQVSCIGYRPEARELQLQPASVVRETIALARVANTWTPIQFTAHFADMSGYDDVLELEVWGAEDLGEPRRRAGRVVIPFRDGVATERVEFPPGSYRFVPRGYQGDPSGKRAWWSPAGKAVDLEIAAVQGVIQVALELAGAPVTLTVVDQDAQPVRGFDLHLLTHGKLRESGPMWDMFSVMGQSLGDVPTEAVLWLAPGDYRIRAELPGIGAGFSDLTVPDSRETQRLTIRLGR